MKSNKGYSNRAKSGNKASLAHQRQAAARASVEKAVGKRRPKRPPPAKPPHTAGGE